MNTAQREWMRTLTEAVHLATGQSLAQCTESARVILNHLSREFGGERVYVPVVLKPSLPTERILKMLREGQSHSEVAARFNVTSRTIRNYVKRADGTDAIAISGRVIPRGA